MAKQSLFEQTVKADTEAALSIVDMEQKQELLKKTEQEHREALLAKTHEMVGQIRAAGMLSKFANVSSLVWLQQVKKSKIYKDLPNIGTWESFCNYIGISRQKADIDIQNLATFGEEFLLTVSSLSVGYRELRKLSYLTKDGDIIIDAECVVIGEERIPLTPDHTEDLQAAIESLLESRDKKIEDREATIRVKDRLIGEKEKVIQKQEKIITKTEQRLAERGLAPGEENFIQDMEKLKARITMVELTLDPRNMPEEMTPLMTAALIETLGHGMRVLHAHYDEAVTLYGHPDTDGGWTQPEDDIPLPTEDPAPGDCSACQWHKAMSNSKKGVKIPGGFGKCTRPEGHCNPTQPNTGI